jgi:hypothetical protein
MNGSTDNHTLQETTPTTTSATAAGSTGLLEPSLKLNYSTIENNLHKSDQAFAREVVKLIAERAENGIFARDCWGYKFLDPPVLNPLSSQLLLPLHFPSYLSLWLLSWDTLIEYFLAYNTSEVYVFSNGLVA